MCVVAKSPKQPSIILKISPESRTFLVSQKDQEKIIHAFVSIKVDYCNVLLTSIPKKIIKQLQLIQNAAAK